MYRGFNTIESYRLVALVAVFDEALSLFENDAATATECMITPVRGLGSKRPLDMMETKAVFDLIGRLERGSSRVRFDRRLVGLRS